jgi:predicted anti-sigma-YlaC factor YlaD
VTQSCPTTFDETLISGYLDGELTQADDQRVRLHIRRCDHCRELFEEMMTLREAAMTTRFEVPDDDQWNESPRGGLSWATRSLGWLMAVVWVVVVTGFGLWQAWNDTQSLLERVLVFGGLSAFTLLLVSVIVDRVATWKFDRYRGVKR